jgi:hypothetical protein
MQSTREEKAMNGTPTHPLDVRGGVSLNHNASVIGVRSGINLNHNANVLGVRSA